uniref:Uncharacterized protein n=1 Tax=Steinernema glaseri TaxID=37863 RepID=A0A1I8A1N1_9BILA
MKSNRDEIKRRGHAFCSDGTAPILVLEHSNREWKRRPSNEHSLKQEKMLAVQTSKKIFSEVHGRAISSHRSR